MTNVPHIWYTWNETQSKEEHEMNEQSNERAVRIQDDLYQAVNGAWLASAVIPDDRPFTGGFAELDMDVERTLMADFRALAAGDKTTDLPEMRYAAALYRKALDTERRNREGIAPALPLLETVRAIRSLEDLNRAAPALLMAGVELPVQVDVAPDMQDAEHHAFVVAGPDIILPDTAYYAPDHAEGRRLLAVFSDMAARLLAFTPLSETEQRQYLADTLAYDALIAQKVKSQLEWSEYFKCHNPMDAEQVAACTAPFDLPGLLTALYGDKAPRTLIVYDPRAIQEMSGYFRPENLELYLHWAYVKALVRASLCLSEPMAALGRSYGRALTGAAADPTPEKQAYQLASQTYAEPVGIYYGRTYFGEEAKRDITALAKKVIGTYQRRIEKNAFLAPSTKETAIRKLAAMEVKMGYPDAVGPLSSRLVFEEDDSLFAAMQRLGEIRRRDGFERLLRPVDRTEWLIPGHMVNACYNPSCNDVTFPAAILQPPFYALRQSVSENLGGIGAVIGHEVSHAFDNNGAMFDEHGNLHNWWTEEDLAAFQALTQRMVEQFDGIPYHGGTVNGALVVSENIADNGGMGVTLEILRSLPDPDFRAYFINYARVWCLKSQEEYIRLRLASDVHSPNELRANMNPRNFPEWYAAFGVTDKDGMYLPPEKRISIW